MYEAPNMFREVFVNKVSFLCQRTYTSFLCHTLLMSVLSEYGVTELGTQSLEIFERWIHKHTIAFLRFNSFQSVQYNSGKCHISVNV